MPFEVPESWEWTTIGEIASSILYGVSESAKEKGTYKLLRITDIQNNKVNWETVPFTDYDNNKAQAYLLNDGDILFARTGATVGKSYLVEGLKNSAIYASYLIRVQTSSVILPAYIKFFFESGFYWEQISLNSVGIGQPNVNGTTLAALTISIPPYREQLRIVEEAKKWLMIIDELDVEIDDLQTSIAHAKSKILDLAIHGKLVPQDPNDEPAIELLKRINPKFTPCDNAHDTNQLPDSWCWSTLGDVCSFISGYSYSSSEYKKAGIPLVRISDINDGIISLDNCAYIQPQGERNVYLQKGDILIAMSGATTGKMGIYMNEESAILNQRVGVVRVTDSKIISEKYRDYFLYRKSSDILKLAYGGAQPNISGKMICSLLLPLPPYSEQLRIVAKIEELFAVLDEIQKSIED